MKDAFQLIAEHAENSIQEISVPESEGGMSEEIANDLLPLFRAVQNAALELDFERMWEAQQDLTARLQFVVYRECRDSGRL